MFLKPVANNVGVVGEDTDDDEEETLIAEKNGHRGLNEMDHVTFQELPNMETMHLFRDSKGRV
jgi:hypothetical protein